MPIILNDATGLAAPTLLKKFPTTSGWWYECPCCGRHVEGLSDFRNTCQECLAPVICRYRREFKKAADAPTSAAQS